MDPNEWMKEFLQEDSDEKTAAPAEQPAQATPPQAPTAPAPAAPTPAAPTPAAPAPAAPVAAAPGSKDAPLGSIEAVADKWSAQVILKLPNPESFTMNDLLAALVFCRGSDLHLNIGVPPIFRIDGGLLKTTLCEMTPAMNERLIKVILNDQQRQILQQERQLDMAYALPKVGRFRVNCFYTRKGLCAVLRAIPLKIKSLEELGMLEVLKDIIEHPNGMVLVTGPTGSGKTTTLAAIVDYINQSKKHHIITIEDPVEFEHVSNNSLISQRQVGVDTDSFAAALRAALREDPDIILVGELRDIKTIRLAITASETGHLVLGTLHTNNATKTVERIIDIFPQEQQNQIRMQLADSIRAILAQRLVPIASGIGRVAALEIMVGVSAVKNLIREKKTHQLYSIISTQRDAGMITLDQSLIKLYQEGQIKLESAKELFEYPKEAIEKMQKMGLKVE